MSAYTFSRARAETRRDRRHVSVPRGACRSGPAIVFQAGDWTAKGLALPAGDTTLTVTRTAQDQTTAQAQASVTRPADATQFTHDPNGNMLGEGLWQYTWDEENRLVAVTPTGPAAASRPRLEYVYDGLGRRRLRRTYSWDAQGATWSLQAETRFVWDSWVLLRETTVTPGNGETLNRTYTCGLDLSGQLGGEGMDPMSTAGGIGGILAFTSSSSALPAPSSALFLYDGNGNAANLVDAASAATLATYEYGPFGNTLVASGPLAEVNPIRFSSKYFEGAQPHGSSTQPSALSPQPSLYYYGYRYYAPGLGRWTSRDPIGERGGVGLYVAVANGPTYGTDVLGHIRLGRTVNLVKAEVCKSPVVWDLDVEPEGFSPGDPEYAGAIVQHVRMEARVWGCCGDPPPQTFPDSDGPWRSSYYEAMGVSGGLIVFPPGHSVLAVDRYATGRVAAGTQGYVHIVGEFAFYSPSDFLGYDTWFGNYPVPEAGALPAYYSPPQPPLPGFGSRIQSYRAMTVEWHCCRPDTCDLSVKTSFGDVELPLPGPGVHPGT